MIKLLAALGFYTRFALPFSRIGHRRRVRSPLVADFAGQRWVVTGATGGIGRAIALGAAARGATVLALARDAVKLADLVRTAAGGPGRVVPVVCDLARMADLRRAARSIARTGPLDVVVHNVGVMQHAFARTDEGVERSLATNLLGHWVLDRALREGGALNAGSAIVSMSSGGQYGAKLDLQALEAKDAAGHDGFLAYAQHKRAQVELTRFWNLYGAGAPRAWVMHPGWVDTEGVRTALPGFRRLFGRVLRSPEEGADTALWLAATRPLPADGGLWLDRVRDDEHAFGFTRGGADALALAEWLEARAA